MPLRAFTFGLAASAIILSTVAGLPTPAQAAVPASCSETATVSAGIPDLLSSTVSATRSRSTCRCSERQVVAVIVLRQLGPVKGPMSRLAMTH